MFGRRKRWLVWERLIAVVYVVEWESAKKKREENNLFDPTQIVAMQ